MSFSSFNVISEETFSSWDPLRFRLVLDGLVFSILGLLAATCNGREKSSQTEEVVEACSAFASDS